MAADDCPWAVMTAWALAADDPVLSFIPGIQMHSHIQWWHNCRCDSAKLHLWCILGAAGRVLIPAARFVQILYTTGQCRGSWLRGLPHQGMGGDPCPITARRGAWQNRIVDNYRLEPYVTRVDCRQSIMLSSFWYDRLKYRHCKNADGSLCAF